VLGKHSGRHALSVRCAALGYNLDRRQLDDLYRRFVALADMIKTVDEHHLLGLIRETQGARIAPVGATPGRTGSTFAQA
jgi:2-isopropylmalate synthase